MRKEQLKNEAANALKKKDNAPIGKSSNKFEIVIYKYLS